ncbi:MAG: T9SS type A sorting domain-containing protein [Bacteroidetes bacterium]|nr:T9SS type A sorting domain-containing protein [Bacteroidota bacterium]
MKKFLLFYTLSFSLLSANAQGVAIGQWRDHLPYNKGIAVGVGGSNIYCATSPGMFNYDTQDKTISRMSKAEGYSDVAVNSMAYSATYKMEILGYSNGNIDLVIGQEIVNIPDIKRSSILGNKTINHICVSGDLAYISCGFGIVVLDLAKREIKDTYKIGMNGSFVFVNEIAVYHDKIYAATKEGVYVASLNNSNLAAFQSWSKAALPDGNFNTIDVVNDLLYTNFDKANSGNQDTIFAFNNSVWSKPALGVYYNNNDIKDINASATELLICLFGRAWVVASDYSLKYEFTGYHHVKNWPDWATVARPMELVEKGGEYWVADSLFGLIHFKEMMDEQIIPNGPDYADVWDMKAKNGTLWVATGGYSGSIGQTWTNKGFYSYNGAEWTNYNDVITPGWATVRDLITVAPHPTDNSAYFGSFGYGLIGASNGSVVAAYNKSNSTLKDYNTFGTVLVTGLDFDTNNNLWALNSGMLGFPVDEPLHLFKNGQWTGYKIPALTSNASVLIKLMIDSDGNKWMIKTKTNFGAVVVKESTGGNFNVRHFSINEGSGKLPSEKVNDIAQDKKGKIWFATDQGVAVLDFSSDMYKSNVSYDVQQVLIQEDGVWHHLLESQRVTAIAIDGGNKKWFGTEGSGVFQLSEDGSKQLQHFTKENSALISDNILDIAIDDVTGEVFFGTDRGIVSYRGTATEGEDYNGIVYAYPNPVTHDFTGTIGIKGLVKNAFVKITDITGTLVYETRAEGGQATWDGKRNGERVQTGVYLVFISNDDGTETAVTKILFIN